MNTENKNIEMLYKSNPTVAALNKVPGFDPLKLLRRTKSAETNEPVLRLDLPYKKLWFRLANPKGRIRVNALRVTEQMAIYEAQIYLNSDDAQPVGSFTAQCTKDSVPDGQYIEAAQQMAVNEALSDAGYGIQFADVSMRPEDRRYGSEIPVTAVQTTQGTAAVQPVVETTAPAMAQPAAKEPVPDQIVTAPAQSAPAVQPAAKQTVSAQTVTAAAQPAPAIHLPAKETVPEKAVTTALQPIPAIQSTAKQPVPAQTVTAAAQPVPAIQPAVKAEQPAPAKAPEVMPAAAPAEAPGLEALALAQTAEALKPQPAVSTVVPETAADQQTAVPYTQETPKDEILRVMTLDQAFEVVVDSGVCNGWTLHEVAKRRPACLKFYIYSYKGKNNILRAAAQLVLDSLTAQNAA